MAESVGRVLRRGRPDGAQPDGQAGVPTGVLPVRRQRRWSLALAAVLVALLSALAFLAWAGSLSDQRPVVAAARTVNAGDVITRADLRVVRISSDGDVAAVPGSRLDRLVGKVAASPLYAGSLVASDQVSREAPLGADEAIVGVLVKPGQAPLANLRVGTTVQVVQTAGSSPVGGGAPVPLADEARVFAVSKANPGGTPGGVGDGVLVSLRVPQSAAAEIVSAADAERIRLVVVGGVTR